MMVIVFDSGAVVVLVRQADKQAVVRIPMLCSSGSPIEQFSLFLPECTSISATNATGRQRCHAVLPLIIPGQRTFESEGKFSCCARFPSCTYTNALIEVPVMRGEGDWESAFVLLLEFKTLRIAF